MSVLLCRKPAKEDVTTSRFMKRPIIIYKKKHEGRVPRDTKENKDRCHERKKERKKQQENTI